MSVLFCVAMPVALCLRLRWQLWEWFLSTVGHARARALGDGVWALPGLGLWGLLLPVRRVISSRSLICTHASSTLHGLDLDR